MVKPQHQYSLSLIPHHVGSSIVQQRASDGYINATELCRAAGKRWNDYFEPKRSQDFFEALARKTGKPVLLLIQRVRNSDGVASTWIHPHIAINLGQWLSADFAVQVSEWVHSWMSGKGAANEPAPLPYHLQRYLANDVRVSPGYFSVLQETALNLFGPMHNIGFQIPQGWVPDISVGKGFCKWLRDEKGIDTDELPTYMHDYQDGRIVKANLYPDVMLADFRTWFRTVWLPVNGVKYFKSKDPGSLVYLDRHPALSAAPRPTLIPSRKSHRSRISSL